MADYDDGRWPAEVVEPCQALVEVDYVKPGVSSKKGTKQLGFKLKIIKSDQEDNNGMITPFINVFFSEKLKGKNNSLARACGLELPPASAYEQSPPESFTPDTDREFFDWGESFKGKQFLAVLGVEEQEGYNKKNTLNGTKGTDTGQYKKFMAKMEPDGGDSGSF